MSKSKNGKFYKLPNEENQVILTEGDVEVCIIYPATEEDAHRIIEEWKAGTYHLLRG